MDHLSTDIIVIAAGPAGLAAAVSAAEKGAGVMIFEKSSRTGGTANMGMGPFGVESRIQRKKLKGPTREEAFQAFMNYTHWRGDAQLVSAYISKSATTIDWLEDMGVVFDDALSYFPGGYPTWHIVKPEKGEPGPTAAALMLKRLTERAESLGVTIHLKTPALKLLQEDGGITGGIVEDPSGDQRMVKAKAVIIATGGFGDNPEMIEKHTPYTWGKDMLSMRIPGIAGDGIRMAWEAGAARTDMTMEMIYLPAFQGGRIHPAIGQTFSQPHLMVNLQGERFMDEGVMMNATFTGNALSAQKDRTGFLIYDEAIKDLMETEGFDHLNLVFRVMKSKNIAGSIQDAIQAGVTNVFMADSIRELAEKSGIDPQGLEKTVEQYNGFCAKGRDDIFYKKHQYLRPVEKPKFYMARLQCSAYGSLGGIKINHRTEVLDHEWTSIPGLYAAGTDACSIYGDSYPFILPGNTMGFALNTGRIAGESAADYVKRMK